MVFVRLQVVVSRAASRALGPMRTLRAQDRQLPAAIKHSKLSCAAVALGCAALAVNQSPNVGGATLAEEEEERPNSFLIEAPEESVHNAGPVPAEKKPQTKKKERTTTPTPDLETVKEKTSTSKSMPDPEKELLHRRRIVLLTGTIDGKLSRAVCSQLLYLDSVDSRAPITLVINSNGGTVTDGLAIYDTMQYVAAPVHTLCMGQASSMASVLLAGGAKGQRKSLPNSRIMIHSASNSFNKMQTEDIIIRAEELREKNELLLKLLAEDTGNEREALRNHFGRNYYMSALRAQELGIIDSIISKQPNYQ